MDWVQPEQRVDILKGIEQLLGSASSIDMQCTFICVKLIHAILLQKCANDGPRTKTCLLRFQRFSVHVPVDFCSCASFEHAFVNMLTHEDVLGPMQQLGGSSQWLTCGAAFVCLLRFT